MPPRKAFQRLLPRWSRTDSVVAQVVLLLLMAGVTASLLYVLVWITPLSPAGGGGWMNQATVYHPDGAPGGAPGVEPAREDVTVSAAETVVVTFDDPSTRERLLLALPTLVRQVTSLAVAFLVLRIVQSLKAGDPFVPANVRRLYGIAFTVMAAALVWTAVDGTTAAALQRAALPVEGHVLFEVRLDSGAVSGLLVGFLLAALAEVFRRGTRMRDDVEGLV
ncbi:hypothetical protein GCM10007079_39330 [Nocardiopsis terrae]|uniref:DUF2975 domain-containing protein n=1 Tax=Nocardiopsis terrae TaxID=372655 RepID=A0ABR9HEU9_9ACTN|nr:DUF2975 domain-containing protein [Nocardiopsis terrae]MBE1457320.1 hypothetical protein [Nocardiopsis terrae]GHC91730.1 hypothetical protein GCM10007079_39330 [Nocardiopsis terrae]